MPTRKETRRKLMKENYEKREENVKKAYVERWKEHMSHLIQCSSKADIRSRMDSECSRLVINLLQTNFSQPLTWNRSEVEDYACRFISYEIFKHLCRSLESNLSLICGILGFLGALCMVITLIFGHFRPSSDFLLFRTVGYLEMVQMAVMATMAALTFCKCEESYVCAFVWAHVATTIMNICADTVDLIVLFLSIERTAACLSPHHFHLIKSSSFRQSVVLCSFALPTIFSIIQAFEVIVIYDENEKVFLDETSDLAYTDFYTFFVYANMGRFYVTAALIVIATLSSMAGFVKAAKRKQRLLTIRRRPSEAMPVLSQTSPKGSLVDGEKSRWTSAARRWTHRLSDFNTVRRQISQINRPLKRKSTDSQMEEGGVPRVERRQREVELCCLQLCLAVPIVVNQILYASGLNQSYSFYVGKPVFDYGLNYSMAIMELDRAYSFHSLRSATNISNILAHALHFYLYLIFSVKIRQDFWNLIRNWNCKGIRKSTDGTRLTFSLR